MLSLLWLMLFLMGRRLKTACESDVSCPIKGTHSILTDGASRTLPRDKETQVCRTHATQSFVDSSLQLRASLVSLVCRGQQKSAHEHKNLVLRGWKLQPT